MAHPATGCRTLRSLSGRVSRCRLCPRLVRHRERIAREKTRRFAEWSYWGRPVPGFGDPRARMIVVGLAPAAHGANRTGRIFTGDRSGDWLFASLHRNGFASQAKSVSPGDGLELRDAWVTAAVRCAPPANKPTPDERDRCRPWLERELDLLDRAEVFVALGGYAFSHLLRIFRDREDGPRQAPGFGHGVRVELPSGRRILASYHPSQQNTFTGRLTKPMLDRVFREARRALFPSKG